MSDRPDQPEATAEVVSAVSETRSLPLPSELPVLPLRDTVLFPNSFMPLAVAREASVRLVEEASVAGRLIGVFTQREASVEAAQVAEVPRREARPARMADEHWARPGHRVRERPSVGGGEAVHARRAY